MAEGPRGGPAKAIISPSILSSDFARLADECQCMLDLGADWLHVDVMDGHFVPNLTLGPPILQSLRRHLPDAFLDVHLMVSHPAQWVDAFAAAGASMFTFHLEAAAGGEDTLAALQRAPSPVSPSAATAAAAVAAAGQPGTGNGGASGAGTTGAAGAVGGGGADASDAYVEHEVAPFGLPAVHDLIEAVKGRGMRCGMTVKPGTPVELLLPYIPDLDMVLVMCVEPGFGGQSFMPETMHKVRFLRDRFPDLPIQVDGGLGPDSIQQAAEAGANVIVAGSAIFGAEDPGAVIGQLREAVEAAGEERVRVQRVSAQQAGRQGQQGQQGEASSGCVVQ